MTPADDRYINQLIESAAPVSQSPRWERILLDELRISDLENDLVKSDKRFGIALWLLVFSFVANLSLIGIVWEKAR